MIVVFESIDTMRKLIEEKLLEYNDEDLNISINDDQSLIQKSLELQAKVLPYAIQLANGKLKFPKDKDIVMLF